MNEERRRILNLLAEKRITAEEADRLGQALGPRWKIPFAVGTATREFAKPGRAAPAC